MTDSVDFEILINGVSRTWRDVEGTAIDAARMLFSREKDTAAIVVINRRTGERCQIKDGFSVPVWLLLSSR